MEPFFLCYNLYEGLTKQQQFSQIKRRSTIYRIFIYLINKSLRKGTADLHLLGKNIRMEANVPGRDIHAPMVQK